MHETAKVIEWKPQWDIGAPMPQVFSNGQKTYLIYLINKAGFVSDVADLTLVDNSSENIYSLALVEFNGQTFRFGIANDETFSALPLWRKGLVGYLAHIIDNSSWISELKKIDKVHPYYSEDKWARRKHFALLFHDEIFEVVATDFKIETFRTTFKQLAIEVAERMNRK
jgi:hypothetical protein